MAKMTLDEMAPYVLGKKFSDQPVAKRSSASNDKFVRMVNESVTAKVTLEAAEDWHDFYAIEKDFANIIPKDDKEEAFYAAKNGEYSLLVPSFMIYMIKRAYFTEYKSPNLILKQMHERVLNMFFSKGYLGGSLTVQDVICSVCDEHYVPLSKTNLRNKCLGYTEIYVQSTDMVALLPNTLADLLDDNSIDKMVVTESGLSTGGQILRTMGGLRGIVNSVYDLRKVI